MVDEDITVGAEGKSIRSTSEIIDFPDFMASRSRNNLLDETVSVLFLNLLAVFNPFKNVFWADKGRIKL